MSGLRVLMVDDDTYLQILLSMAMPDLERSEAAGVEEATKLVAEREFDAIVIDRRLADGDGLDLVRALRRKGSRAVGTPILVFTAGHEERERVTLLRAGADEYLAKMAEVADLSGLERRIERLVAMTPAQRSARRRELVRRLRAGEVGDLDPPPPAPAAEVAEELEAAPEPTRSPWWQRRRR